MGLSFPKAKFPRATFGRSKTYVEIEGKLHKLPLPRVDGFKDAVSFHVRASAEMLKIRLAYETWKKKHGSDKANKRMVKRAGQLFQTAAKAEREMTERISKLSDMVTVLDKLEAKVAQMAQSDKGDQLDAIKTRIEGLKGKTETQIKMVGINTRTLEDAGKSLVSLISDLPAR